MRTRFEIVLAGGRNSAALQAAGEEAMDEIERAESLLSAFQYGADLHQINARAAREAVRVSPLVIPFLRHCCALAEATDGSCDIAVGALLDCWRIQQDGSDREPDAHAIAEALAACDVRRQLHIDDHDLVRLLHPRARLDPGAVGKGWAIDRAVKLLRELGVPNGLVHGGTSTAYGFGNDPGRDGWTIAVQHPTDAQSIIATACLHNSSLSVSGLHGRTVNAGARVVGHIIDPRSGQPVTDNLLAAAIHPSAMVSDALSTALMVLGKDGLSLLRARFSDASLLLAQATTNDDLAITTVGDGFICK
jgi:thiamine biosynthesis lipoprotein